MKKNISINIGGIIFHIEEDGYDTLRKYLDSINAYFSSYEDNSEILADIESRIAEIFLSKLSDGKQVVTKDDVASLIHTMGSVSDFKAAEEQGAPQAESQKKSEDEFKKEASGNTSAGKKLHRDQRRKILGGVCAGLGHYFNVDPVWPRLLFALLVLGSYGSLMLIYIILWIFLPGSTELEEEGEVKKLFRDPEKKVIGGVASGVAAFFGADTTLIRILFVVFSIVGGLGFLIYVILWIALPEAKSITEKMQMQGEPVTLSNIETTVKKSLNEKEAEEESILAKIILFPFRLIAAILNGIAKGLGPLFSVLVEILRVGFGVLFVMIGLVMLISLFFSGGVFLGMVSSSHWMWWDMNTSGFGLPMEAIRNTFPTWVILTGFLMSIIPALFIALLGASVIAKRIIFKPIIGWSLFVLFFVCLAILSFKIPQTIYSFKEEGTHKEEITYVLNGKMPVFKLNEVGLEDYDVTSIRILGYEGKDIQVVKEFEAQGNTRKVAEDNAQMVEYNITQKDSILTFDSNITFKKDAQFRAQRLDIKLYIPFDQPFIIENELWQILDNYGRHYSGKSKSSETWKITTSGLECTSCFISPQSSSARSEDQYGLADFDAIDISGLFNVRIEQGDEYSVEIQGSQQQKDHYHIYLENSTLVVDYDKENETYFWKNNLFEDDKVSIDITLPHLKELNVKGAGKIKFRGFEENDFEISLLGAVVADGHIEATSLSAELTGASFLDLEGEGSFMEADLTGASGLRAYGYEVDRAVIKALGASIAKVYVNETLEIDESFASKVSYRGDAQVIKK